MRKFTLLILTMVFAIAVQAGMPFKLSHKVATRQMPIKREVVNQEKVKAPSKSDMKTSMRRTNKAARVGGSSRVITDQPEGEAKTYKRSGEAIYASSGSISVGEDNGLTKIVFDADGATVYFKNILYNIGSYFGDSWVTGTISDNKITVPVGQSIYWSDSYQADVVLAWGSTSVADNKISFVPDTTVKEITYIIDEEAGTISLEGGGSIETEDQYAQFWATGIGCYWTDDDSFGGFLDWGTVFTPFDESDLPTVITEQPEGELTTYYRSGQYIASSWTGISNGEVDGKMNVVVNADEAKAYIQNPMWWHDSYNSWVEGSYDAETGIISVPVGQYISYSADYFYGIQVGWGRTYTTEAGVDEETGEMTYNLVTEQLEDVEEILFQIDADTIRLLNSEGDINAEFPTNYHATGIYSYWSDDLSFTAVEFNTKGVYVQLIPAVPANPTADDWYDCGDESGFSKFYFTLPTTDVNGVIIDPEYLSYSIFTDEDELFTFDAENYTYDLTEDITEVPYYLYSSAVDFHNNYCYIYRTNEEGFEPLFTRRIGIQVYYTVDGVKNASKIVYWPAEENDADFYIAGEFSNWAENPVKFEKNEEGVLEAEVKFEGENEDLDFKIITPAADGGWIWFGGYDKDEEGYCLIDSESYGILFRLYSEDNPNFRVEEEGEYIINLVEIFLDAKEGNSRKVSADGILGIMVNKKIPTGISTVTSGEAVSTRYVNLAGQMSDKPFNGVNIMVTTMSDGSKRIVKVVK